MIGFCIVLCLIIICATILSAIYLSLKFENDYPLSRSEFNDLYRGIKEIKSLLEDKE